MTPSPEVVQDVLAIGMHDLDLETLRDREIRQTFLAGLEQVALKTIWSQWSDPVPIRVDDFYCAWLITSSIKEVEEFRPVHDCPRCWMGSTLAREFLEKHADGVMALGNIRYVPIWAGRMRCAKCGTTRVLAKDFDYYETHLWEGKGRVCETCFNALVKEHLAK